MSTTKPPFLEKFEKDLPKLKNILLGEVVDVVFGWDGTIELVYANGHRVCLMSAGYRGIVAQEV